MNEMNKMSEKKFHVTGMGAALVDVYAHVSDVELAALGSSKGGSTLVSPEESAALIKKINLDNKASGGSAANTIAGLAALGLSTAFIGKVADDAFGNFFANDLNASKTAFPTTRLIGGAPTGHCIVLITPDAERTMHAMIGAAGETTTDDLDAEVLRNSAYFFSEGYVLDSPSAGPAFEAACDMMHQNGGRVAFSLSDPDCVARHHARYKKLITSEGGKVDMLIGNESEALVMFGVDDFQSTVSAAQQTGIIIAVTRGEKGAAIITPEGVTEIKAAPVSELIDLTGAGDQFAAGLLSGLAQGKSLVESGHRGAIAAAEVITHIGPRPIADIGALIRQAGY